MLYIGPLSSIFDYVTFAVMYFIFKANTPEHQGLFQTGWFVEGYCLKLWLFILSEPKRFHLSKAGRCTGSCINKLNHADRNTDSFHLISRISENAAFPFNYFPIW